MSVTDSQTLQFESGRVLQSLYGNDLSLLKALEKTLEVRVTARDGWLRVFYAIDDALCRVKRKRGGGVSLAPSSTIAATLGDVSLCTLRCAP